MFYFTFEVPENLTYDVDGYFNSWYEPEWFDDPLVRQMVLDIDKTEVVNRNMAISPVFGPIPITKISGGVKQLIMLLKLDKIGYGSACGDNCSDWMIKISQMRDITVYFGHDMKFFRDFEGICLDTGRAVHTPEDFICCWLESQGFDDIWESYDPDE